MTLTIRPGRPSDKRAIAAMLGEFMTYFAEIDPVVGAGFPKRELDRTAGLAFARNPVYSLLVAERDRRPIAFLAYHFGVWEIYPALYVAGLFVTKSARGTGIGHALMMAAQRLAAGRGAQRITWTVWRKNKSAIKFYERLGAVQNDEDVAMVWNVEKPSRAGRAGGRRKRNVAKPRSGKRKR